MHGGKRLLWLDASRAARDAPSAARDLALADEHIFPTLRLAPIPGETGLENVLRQIDALSQRRLPPPAPPAGASPASNPALPPPLALPPPKPPAPRAPPAQRKPRLARVALELGAGTLLVFALLLPPQVLPSAMEPRAAVEAASIAHPGRAPAAAPSLRAGPGVLIVAMPPPPAAPAFAALKPAAGPPTLVARAPASVTSEAAATPRPTRPPSAVVAAAPAPATAARPKPPKPAAAAADLTAPLLLARGNELLAMGDVISARQFFARAQASGAADATRSLAVTYDPLFLREIGAVGVKPDAAAAASLYRQAAKAGDAAAASRLTRLGSAPPGLPASGAPAPPPR